MLNEISKPSENERSFEVFPDSFSWSELMLSPSDFQFGPQESNPSTIMMVVKYSKSLNQNHFRTDSIFEEIDVSAFIIQCAVRSAIFLKSTSIPEKITNTVETVVEFSSVMEQHYAIKAKVKEIGHVFVSALINIVTTLIAATLQFIIAYHNAPGKSDGRREEMEKLYQYSSGRTRPEMVANSTLITFSVGGQFFTTNLEHVLSRKRTVLGKKAINRKSLSDPVFLDRDPTHFRHIVNFIRGASSISHIRDQQTLDELLEEAQFYDMDDLMENILLRKSELSS